MPDHRACNQPKPLVGAAQRPPWMHPLILFGLILLSLVVRCWDSVMQPVMAVEDGTIMFMRYFHAPHWSAVLEFYAGYLPLVSNLIAWLATKGPVTWVPAVFVGSALVFGALGPFLLTRPAYAWLLKDPADRALLVLVLCCLPLGRGIFYSNLTYSQWSLLFLLLVLICGRLPDSKAGLWLTFVGASLCVFAHPLSLIALPICVAHLFLEKRPAPRILLAGCIAVIVLYQLVGVERGAPVSLSLDSVRVAMKFWLGRVVFEGLAGAKATVGLMAKSPQFVSLLGAAMCGAFCLLYLRPAVSRLRMGAAVLGLGVAAACLFIGAAVRLVHLPLAEQLNPHLQRYFYISKLILAVLVLAEVIPWLRSRVAGWQLPAKLALIGSLALYLGAVNTENAFLYHSSRDEGIALRKFLRQVDEELERAKSGQPYQADWEFTRTPGPASPWSIKLNIKQHLGPTEPAAAK